MSTTKSDRAQGTKISKNPSSKLPVPVSVELHNFFPNRIPRKKWFRPEHTRCLLFTVRLEVSILEDEKERVLHVADDTRKSMCPTWTNLEEFIHTRQFSANAYGSMKAKCFLLENNEAHGISRDATHFLEINLHPNMLCRIANLPTIQPPNFVVVRFSDKSMRVKPAHYQQIVNMQQPGIGLSHESLSFLPDMEDDSGHKESSRFDDSTFGVLDPLVCEGSPIHNRATIQSASSRDLSMKLQGDSSSHKDNNLTLQTLQKRNALLTSLVEHEELCIANESTRLRCTTDEVKAIADQLDFAKAGIQKANNLALTERDRIQKTEFSLEAQKIRLLSELSRIYPISVVEGERRFMIRNLEIPSQVYSGSVPEEVVSAALGYVCHLVVLMSKYLGVHLRYRLYCQSSRSAVQDERSATYPLFQARETDREQVTYAVHLLDMDIECICKARGILLSPKLHILAKLMRVYEHTIDGY